MSLIVKIQKKGLIHPPSWLPENTHYLVMMGSEAYGCSSGKSDMDLYGWCVPPKDMVFPHLAGEITGFGRQAKRFEVWQEHHIDDKDVGKQYDFAIYSVVKFFHLCMENNPNMVDALFVPTRCVLHCTSLANIMRDNRKLFLHKGCWHKFRGYAYSQLHKMAIKNPEPGSKRHALVQEFGFDCYLESETEFLTASGWKRYHNIGEVDLLAEVDPKSGELCFSRPTGRVCRAHSGPMYVLEPYMSRCVVTPNHNMLVSVAHRGKNGYTYEDKDASWSLTPMKSIIDGSRSWYHVRRSSAPRAKAYAVEDDYLKLSGLFVSEGSFGFCNGKVKEARLTQTPNGKLSFYGEADALVPHRYDYEKESVWVIGRKMAERLYLDFGHGSRNKRLPAWSLQLSFDQARTFWDYLCLGDGTYTENGDVYYTINEGLAGDIQAMMVSAGHLCSVRGPFSSICSFTGKPVESFQVYLSEEGAFRCVDFKSKSRFLRHGQVPDTGKGYSLKEIMVDQQLVVCFEMPFGTLVTRSKGRVAIQGNCKFAYHVVRLMLEVEQILVEQDLNLERNSEILKAIRRGEWSEQRIRDFLSEKESSLEEFYHKSTLPYGPDEDKIKSVLLQVMEQHYGSLENAVRDVDVSSKCLREVVSVLERYGVR